MEEEIIQRGLILYGSGKMGCALLKGWLDSGLSEKSIGVIEPEPNYWLKSLRANGLNLNGNLPNKPLFCILAVKPQIINDILIDVKRMLVDDTIILSVMAGIRLKVLQRHFGNHVPIIRAMPNTPALIKKGITSIIESSPVTESQMMLAERIFNTVGKTIRLKKESHMDAVTAISGSGPAYVFYFIEALKEAGIAQGLSHDLALKLACTTVSGAGQLADISSDDPKKLREDVTSPRGTTQAALDILMEDKAGLKFLINRAVKAAADKSRELGK